MAWIPVFVSRPIDLSPTQLRSLRLVEKRLRKLGFELMTFELGDYPAENLLSEVAALARCCSGGVIMGFQQYEITKGTRKAGTRSELRINGKPLRLPSPWNQIEAGVLFGMGLPLLIFREEDVEGGVFTEGSSDFVHMMPGPRMNRDQGTALDSVLLNWSSRVRSQYHRSSTL
jgi:hypothetical protein